jgi:hypothetical protein
LEQVPGSARGAQGVGAYGFVSDQPVSPAELSRALLSAGTVRDAGSADGPGWTGTEYTFTASISGGPVSGTVYVDRQGRVRRLVTITPEGNAIPEGTGLPEGRVTVDRDLTFDDFGVQAAVTAPPASQTEYTSYPYWGFYF